jgi:nucleoside-diphosphate-sugar epimerase/GT2 family glycosyltransferase
MPMTDTAHSSDILVSVAIVNFNGGHYLLDTVRAVLASTVPIEVLVVDNGSEDDSISNLRDELCEEARLRVIENGENLGFAKANNVALKQARGRYLLLLNPDCIVAADTLEQMVRALEADPHAGMAGCLIQNPDGTEQPGCRRTIPTPWTGLVRALHLGPLLGKDSPSHNVDLVHSPLPERPVYVEAISGAFMLIRREALEQVGLMDDRYFLHCEDLDWCKSFQESGWQILFVPQVRIVHHKGVCSAHRPIFVLWHKHKGMVRFYRKFLSKRYPLPLNLLVVVGVWSRFAFMVPVELARRIIPGAQQQNDSAGGTLSARPLQHPLHPDLRGRKVLVTGGTGFIGTRLVDELLRQGAEVRVLSRSPEQVTGRWGGRVSAVAGDLETGAGMPGVCDGIDTLFHLASCAHMLDLPVDDSARHRQVTEQGTLDLLHQARGSGLARFVFVSSVKAMGEEADACQDEASEPHPETAYGIAKLHAEQAVLAAGREDGMAATVLRLPMVYGPGNKGNLPRMVDAIRHGRFPPLPKVHNRRSMVHVDDVVQALLLSAVREQAAGQVYIVTDGRVYSTAEIYRLIAASLGRRVPRWHVPLFVLQAGARLGDLLLRLGTPIPLHTLNLRKLLGSAWYSNRKITDELGFAPRHDLRHALPEMDDVNASPSRQPAGSGTWHEQHP